MDDQKKIAFRQAALEQGFSPEEVDSFLGQVSELPTPAPVLDSVTSSDPVFSTPTPESNYDPTGKTFQQIMAETGRQSQLDTLTAGGTQPIYQAPEFSDLPTQESILPTAATVTQPYGKMNAALEPYSGGKNLGTDFRAAEQTPLAVPPGKWRVLDVYNQARPGDKAANNGSGNMVTVINTQTGETLGYEHLDMPLVKPGQALSGNEVIGLSGNTGNSTGPHASIPYRDAAGNYRDVLTSPYGEYVQPSQQVAPPPLPQVPAPSVPEALIAPTPQPVQAPQPAPVVSGGMSVAPKMSVAPTPAPMSKATPGMETLTPVANTIQSSLLNIVPKTPLATQSAQPVIPETPQSSVLSGIGNTVKQGMSSITDLLTTDNGERNQMPREINPISETPIPLEPQVAPATVAAYKPELLNAVPSTQKEAASTAVPAIVDALKNEGIDDPKVIAYALSTASHESGFVPKEEIMASRGVNARNDYVAGLQDNYQGGKEYRGRGYIQLTHKGNYEKYGKRIGEDLVNNPDRAKDPVVAAKILAAYIKDAGVADAVKKDDYDGARVKVQGKGALNGQFIKNTRAIAADAKKWQQYLGK